MTCPTSPDSFTLTKTFYIQLIIEQCHYTSVLSLEGCYTVPFAINKCRDMNIWLPVHTFSIHLPEFILPFFKVFHLNRMTIMPGLHFSQLGCRRYSLNC